jgi:hypothetical protein
VDVVVAYRGTADLKDILDDAMMSPVKSGAGAAEFGRKLILSYLGERAGWTPDALSEVLRSVYSRRATQSILQKYANQIPQDHGNPALSLALNARDYASKNKYRLRCFVGHSLGGALAQFVSEQTGSNGRAGMGPLPGVSFNGPCMGNIAGMRRREGGGIVFAHHFLDPLSRATNLAGNGFHGKEHEIACPAYPGGIPPEAPQNQTPEQTGKALKALMAWMGEAFLYFHSMDTVLANLAHTNLASTLLEDALR